MKSKLWCVLVLLVTVVMVVGCAPASTPTPPAPTATPVPPTKAPPTALPVPASSTPVPLTAMPAPQVDTASIARGGLLYDEWWKVVGASEPKDDQALWALQTTNSLTGADTWRCKECHGWDYKGKDGAYGSGSHKTGFAGVWDAAQLKAADELVAVLQGSSNPKHDFSTLLQPTDLTDATNFLKYGLVDVSKYVDYATKQPIGGDAARGKSMFDGLCAACHGPDGKKLNFGTEAEPEYVGTLAKDNPSEFLHKARVGQPGSNPPMPSTLVLGWTMQQVVDVLSYVQTLPEK